LRRIGSEVFPRYERDVFFLRRCINGIDVRPHSAWSAIGADDGATETTARTSR